MNNKDSTERVPKFAMLFDFYHSSTHAIILYETIKKLCKLAHFSLPSGRRLILAIFVLASELASKESFCKHWNAQVFDHLI